MFYRKIFFNIYANLKIFQITKNLMLKLTNLKKQNKINKKFDIFYKILKSVILISPFCHFAFNFDIGFVFNTLKKLLGFSKLKTI